MINGSAPNLVAGSTRYSMTCGEAANLVFFGAGSGGSGQRQPPRGNRGNYPSSGQKLNVSK